MMHFVRARDRAAAEHLGSLLVAHCYELCRSSRDLAGDPAIPAWRVETIDCCGETISSARPVGLVAWRPRAVRAVTPPAPAARSARG